MILTTLVVVGGLVLAPPANGSAATFKQIAAECGASVDRSGAGRAVLSRSTEFQNVSGNLPVPCRLYLEQGASLTIADSHLTTQTLTISNEPIQDQSAIFHSNVTIEHSYLFGEEPAPARRRACGPGVLWDGGRSCRCEDLSATPGPWQRTDRPAGRRQGPAGRMI